MNYTTLYDFTQNKYVSIFSKRGKYILKKYINTLLGGNPTEKDRELQVEEIKEIKLFGYINSDKVLPDKGTVLKPDHDIEIICLDKQKRILQKFKDSEVFKKFGKSKDINTSLRRIIPNLIEILDLNGCLYNNIPNSYIVEIFKHIIHNIDSVEQIQSIEADATSLEEFIMGGMAYDYSTNKNDFKDIIIIAACSSYDKTIDLYDQMRSVRRRISKEIYNELITIFNEESLIENIVTKI